MQLIPDRHLWYDIHSRSLEFRKRREFKKFITWIHKNLTCKTCRDHLGRYMKKHKIKNECQKKNKSGYEFFKWTWKLHNDVNRKLGKQELSYNHAKEMYDS